MLTYILTFLLWTAALSSGLIAGVFFAFSVFIMKAFSHIPNAQSIVAMNSINKIITRSLFMPLFFGSSIISLLLIIISLMKWSEPDAVLTLTAGMIYIVGMFMCTIILNVPLNNSLAKVDPNSEEAGDVWINYLKTWTNWNHVRAIASLATCVLSIWVLSNG
jgi:uncharacterized membrane protein